MSYCDHDPRCPGHGPAHDRAVGNAPSDHGTGLKTMLSSMFVPDQSVRRMAPFPRLRTRSDADQDKVSSPSSTMAVMLGYRQGHNGAEVQTYAGTVAKATIQARRAKNRRARVARRLNRR